MLTKKHKLPERELSEIRLSGMLNWLQIKASRLNVFNINALQISLRKVKMKFSEIEIKNNTNNKKIDNQEGSNHNFNKLNMLYLPNPSKFKSSSSSNV
ncbi:hypothetical protein HERIO_2206 [Hepatospora eriocheir]|uniref:Uncharacterized protein n=1 Tax=Hepatospora eriocheir TaxID=1081669 RepID=A0A1X0Q7Q8_9MICR|nr:hypothetical protein HERIO_2206 [Hepatospora eriocheir]